MKIGAGRPRRKPRRREQCGHGRRLPGAEFDDENAVGREQRGHCGGNRAKAVEPVGTAVERRARIEIAHLGGERIDVAGSRYTADWTRSGRTVRQSAAAMSQATNAAGIDAEPPRVRARDHERARARVGSDSERARQFAHEREKERTAPGAEIGDAAAAARAGAAHRWPRAPLRRPFRSPAAAPASPGVDAAASGSRIPCSRRCARPVHAQSAARARPAIASQSPRDRACARRPPRAPA